MLLQLKDDAEIVIVINSDDIEKNKVRGDLGITYDIDVIRLFNVFTKIGLYVSSVVLTRYDGQPTADAFQKRLEALGIKVYHHYSIKGYPSNLQYIISDEGYGRNDYIETSRRLVVVTAPGPGRLICFLKQSTLCWIVSGVIILRISVLRNSQHFISLP